MRKTFFILIIVNLFVACKTDIQVENIEIKQVKTKDSIIVTSYMDGNFLTLFIPIEVEIINNYNSKIELSSIINTQCDSLKKVPYVKTKAHEIDYTFSENESSINSKEIRKIVVYKFFKFQVSDSISRKQIQFIKRNNNKSTKYFNDTIKYKNLDAFKKEHFEFYTKNISNLNCDNLNFNFFVLNNSEIENDEAEIYVSYK